MSDQITIPLTRQQLECLLNELCVDLGFCLPPSGVERLQSDHPLETCAFADAVFRAEGMNPESSSRRLWRQVRDRICVHFDRATDLGFTGQD